MYPRPDSLPTPPQTFAAIPLGAGQEPNAYGNGQSFLWDIAADVGAFEAESVKRNPDQTFTFISRPPERW